MGKGSSIWTSQERLKTLAARTCALCEFLWLCAWCEVRVFMLDVGAAMWLKLYATRQVRSKGQVLKMIKDNQLYIVFPYIID